MTPTTRHVALLSIKYMPTVLSLTCAFKILFNTMSTVQKDIWLFAVNWINVLFCVLILGAFYNLGRCFGFCWKHRSLCRVAGWGYLFYSVFLLMQPDKECLRPIVWLYVAVVLVLTLLYKEVK